MKNGNFIKLNRSMLKWEWYDNINTKTLFLHCLLKANWRSEVWRGITIERGQFVTSYTKLSAETGLSIQQVRNSLANLQTTGELTHTSTTKYGLITVNNYDKYQDDNTQNNTQSNTQPNSKTTVQSTTIEEYKELKEDKETISTVINAYAVDDLDLKETIVEFTKHRTKLKKGMTVKSLKLLLSKLDKYYNTNESKIEALNNSIMNGWLSIYEPKNQSKEEPIIKKEMW